MAKKTVKCMTCSHCILDTSLDYCDLGLDEFMTFESKSCSKYDSFQIYSEKETKELTEGKSSEYQYLLWK